MRQPSKPLANVSARRYAAREVLQGNALLQALAAHLPAGAVLAVRSFRCGERWPGNPMEASKDVAFPLGAVATLVYRDVDGAPASLGLFGRDSLWDAAAVPVPGGTERKHWLVHHPGEAVLVERRTLAAGLESLKLLHEWQRTLAARLAQSALCNRYHEVAEQLAGWLLGNHERYGVSAVQVTHFELSELLGVRRESVSRAISKLAAAGALESHNGELRILSGARARFFACDCQRVDGTPAPG